MPGVARHGFEMPQKGYTAEQIIPMLRRADVELGQGIFEERGGQSVSVKPKAASAQAEIKLSPELLPQAAKRRLSNPLFFASSSLTQTMISIDYM